MLDGQNQIGSGGRGVSGVVKKSSATATLILDGSWFCSPCFSETVKGREELFVNRVGLESDLFMKGPLVGIAWGGKAYEMNCGTRGF